MRLITTFIVTVCAFNVSIAQENPYENIVMRGHPPMDVVEGDDKTRTLLKQGYNATFAEVRIGFDQWCFGNAELDGLLESLDRFQVYRVELEGEMDKLKFATQKLAFVKDIEDRCAKGKSKARFESIRIMDELRATSYRISTELEIERLKNDDSSAKDQ